MSSERRHTQKKVIGALLVVFVTFSTFSIAVSQASYVLMSTIWLVGVWWSMNAREMRWPLVWPLSAFFAASLLAVVLAVSPARAVRAISSEWARVVLFLVCVNHLTTEKQATRLVRLLIAFGTLSALYGLSQTLAMGTEFRIRGTLSHYMTFAGLLMLVSLLAAAQVLFNWRGKRDVWLLAALMAIVAALMMTHTRSAWIGLFVGVVILSMGRRRLLLALPVVALLVIAVAPRAVKDRALSILDIRDATAIERAYMWGSGARLVLDYPVTGVGPGNVRSVYPSYKHPDDPWQPHRPFTHLHNNVIQIAAERGLLGLTAWLGIWITYYMHAARIFRRSDSPAGADRALVWGSLASVSAFLVAGLLEFNFGDSEVIGLVFFIMALLFVPSAGGRSSHEARSGLAG